MSIEGFQECGCSIVLLSPEIEQHEELIDIFVNQKNDTDQAMEAQFLEVVKMMGQVQHYYKSFGFRIDFKSKKRNRMASQPY